jgi:AcrR family transcriptional regulator
LGQVKKKVRRDAILRAAAMLFEAEDYHKSTLPKIAAAAGIPTSSVYVYFNSKLDIAMCIYECWLGEHLSRLERDLKSLNQPRKRVELILKRMWQKIPEDRNCFANNIVQAISTADSDYRPKALMMLRSKISSMIYASLPSSNRSLDGCERVATVIIMAFDGFVINRRLPHRLICDDETISIVCEAILSSN